MVEIKQKLPWAILLPRTRWRVPPADVIKIDIREQSKQIRDTQHFQSE